MGWGSTQSKLGILPFHVKYPHKLNWFGYFLQEELTYQLALNRKIHTQHPDVMQLWYHYLGINRNGVVPEEQMFQMNLPQLLHGEIQKVIRHGSINGYFFFRDESQLQRATFQLKFPWTTPDKVIKTIFQELSKLHPQFKEFSYFPQGYTWESLEAFYQWKLQDKKLVTSTEWNQYRSELEILINYYPDITRLTHTALAALLLLEGTQPTLNAKTLQQAESIIKIALESDPNSAHVHSLLAFIHYAQNDKFSAKSESVIASAHNPSNSIAQIVYGLTIGQTLEEGKQYVDSGLSNNPFLKSFPDEINQNFPFYQAVAPLFQDWTSIPPSQETYKNTLAEGKEFFRQKFWDKARERFETAQNMDPNKLEPQLYQARILLAEGKYEETLSTLQLLNENFPENEQVFLYIGLTYERQQAFSEAEQNYRQALFFNPNHPLALLRLGTVLIKMKHFEESQSFLELLTQKYPNYALGWWNLGILYSYQKSWKNAESALKEALRLDPDNLKIQKFYSKIKENLKP